MPILDGTKMEVGISDGLPNRFSERLLVLWRRRGSTFVYSVDLECGCLLSYAYQIFEGLSLTILLAG
jgi:hypothetical protein